MKLALISRFLVSGINAIVVVGAAAIFPASEAAEIFTLIMSLQLCSGFISNRYRSAIYAGYEAEESMVVESNQIFQNLTYIAIPIFCASLLGNIILELLFFDLIAYLLGVFFLSIYYAKKWFHGQLYLAYPADAVLSIILVCTASISFTLFIEWFAILFCSAALLLLYSQYTGKLISPPKFTFSNYSVMVTSALITGISFIEVMFFKGVIEDEDIVSYRLFLVGLNFFSLTCSVAAQHSVSKFSTVKFSLSRKIALSLNLLLAICCLLCFQFEFLYLLYVVTILAVVVQLLMYRDQFLMVREGNDAYFIGAYFIALLFLFGFGRTFGIASLFELVIFKCIVVIVTNFAILSVLYTNRRT